MADVSSLTCGVIGQNFRLAIRKNSNWIWLSLAALVVTPLISPGINSLALLMIAGAFAIPFAIWLSARSTSIPIMLLLAIQTALVYGIPVLTQNESIQDYSAAEMVSAASEVLIFGCVLAWAWRIGINNRSRTNPRYQIFSFVKHGGTSRLGTLSLLLIGGNLAFKLGEFSGLTSIILSSLPSGAFPIIRTLAQAAGMGGALLGAFCAGSNAYNTVQKSTYWVIFWALFLLEIMSYLLSSATGLICAGSLGLMIGKGKPPITFVVCLAAVCSFFNVSKFEMRTLYWNPELGYAEQSLSDVPPRLMEWMELSSSAIFSPQEKTQEQEKTEQQLADRVNNLINLLWVQKAVQRDGIPLLSGETYTPIPALLTPRIFWPDKPIAHVGQIMLNLHFKRQTIEQTKTTFVAWGLLAEAYGNFGPLIGSFLLGAVLGYSLGRLESWITHFPISSLQAFIVLAFMVKIGTSFEMVASVFITSTFQLLMAIVVASFPLVEKSRAKKTNPPPAPASSSLP